ncbi:MULTISPECIES: YiiX/YebB-like N1pC/P60 family cysteine hydrolase [Clostridium]|uniref:Hydrolase n=1 Tax=Clostridium beijerinckii TaxID=1520 RepID=A0A1S9N2Y7_CLOBE|nr:MULTISPECIES: YiiX/YebB-like N1pC/P60 family cysteine hydrolase [Clostridium]MBN7575800.1 hydrolase [Clostridium beijerinckii]MBN7581222.1 hydrolase [Clostridium beijerinckii]MBN7585809.1 hydrolase [Clostridium beijerinckii]MBO0521421.1 hydrolase [Clostridium beijerinckii]MZK49272.1 hydrolase [Clostridium beijerinckii]
MKKNFIIRYTIFTLLAVVSMSSTVFAKENTAADNTNKEMQQIIEKSKHDSDELIKNWDKLKVTTTPKTSKEINTINSVDSEAAPNSVGSSGDILVTPATVFGNGPITGHAGMVDLNPDLTIESMTSGGVRRYTNDWKTRYTKALCATVKNADPEQAVDYATSKIGSSYNYNFLNKWKTDTFYCSQLVWRAYIEQGIDLDKDGGNAVLPTDLVSDKIDINWRSNY